jgi:hypothetical protein
MTSPDQTNPSACFRNVVAGHPSSYLCDCCCTVYRAAGEVEEGTSQTAKEADRAGKVDLPVIYGPVRQRPERNYGTD